jgi:hypothetical protein
MDSGISSSKVHMSVDHGMGADAVLHMEAVVEVAVVGNLPLGALMVDP